MVDEEGNVVIDSILEDDMGDQENQKTKAKVALNVLGGHVHCV